MGRLVGLSKSGYSRLHPHHAVVNNATIANAAGERLWWGDVDLTTDENTLIWLADVAGFDLVIYHEGDSRRGFVERINRAHAVAVFHPDGTVTLGTPAPYHRSPLSRLIRHSPEEREARPPEDDHASD